MDKRTLFLVLAITLLLGCIIQKIIYGGNLSPGLIIMAIVSAACGFKRKADNQ